MAKIHVLDYCNLGENSLNPSLLSYKFNGSKDVTTNAFCYIYYGHIHVTILYEHGSKFVSGIWVAKVEPPLTKYELNLLAISFESVICLSPHLKLTAVTSVYQLYLLVSIFEINKIYFGQQSQCNTFSQLL